MIDLDDDETSCPGFSKSEHAIFERGIARGKQMALTAANRQIENLQERIRVDAESLENWKANCEHWQAAYTAERGVSDKLTTALQIAVSTCFTEHAHHKYMSDPESPIRALLAEVAAIRANPTGP